ncbi:MAG: hypothetical protein E7Z63_00890 [Thermoplasmata archaeon]|nr:hypothetical protein [Thermoplasmata archaeon]
MVKQPFASKFKETVTDMNTRYSQLLRHEEIGDLRAEYLWTFEHALGLNLDKPLVSNPRYIRVTAVYPLPEEGYISVRKFRLYMLLYEFVMRDAHLLTRDTGAQTYDGPAMYGAFEDRKEESGDGW